jgi:hypothetical protein
MDRRTLLWTLTAFFGATVAFNLVNTLAADESTGTRLALQVVTLVVVVAVIVLVVRRVNRG